MSKVGSKVGSKSYHTSLCKKEGYDTQLPQFMTIMKNNKLTLEDLLSEAPWLKEYISAYRNLENIWQSKTDKGFKSIACLGYSNSVIYRMRDDITVEFMKHGGKPAPASPDYSQHVIKIDPDKILTLPVVNGEIRYENITLPWFSATDLLVNHPERFLTLLGYNYVTDLAHPDKVFTTTLPFCGMTKDSKRVTTIEYREWACAIMPVSVSFLMREKVCKKQPIQGKLDMK